MTGEYTRLPARVHSKAGRGAAAGLLEYRPVGLEAAVPVQVRSRPEVNLEEAEHPLPVPRAELPPRPFEVARPGREGQVVAVPVVVERDRLEARPVGGGEELREHHRRVVPREDVTVRESADVELLSPRGEVHVDESTRLEQRVELPEQRLVV